MTEQSAHPARLGAIAVRGGAITIGSQAVKVAIHFAGIFVLARLLDQTDFGLIAMATAIVGLGEILRDFGLSSAAVQSQTLTDDQRTNLFWLNSCVGLCLALVSFATAPAIGALFNDERLVVISGAVGASFLLNGIQTQFQAELMRQMRFWRLSWTDLASLLAGLATAVVLAASGLGYWALVGQILAVAASRLVLRVSVCDWKPGWPVRRVSVRGLVRFGWQVTATQLLVYSSSNIDRVMLGIRTTPAVVGLYQQSFQLVMTPISQVFPPLMGVALPVLSRTSSDFSTFNRYVRNAQVALGYPLIFIYSVAIGGAEPIVSILLGDSWQGAVPFIRILAIAGCFQSVAYVAYWVFLARGLTASNLRYALVVRPIVVALVIIGSNFGAIGIAVFYALGIALSWPLSILWLKRATPISARSMFVGGTRILAVGALAACAASALSTATRLYSGSSLAALVAAALGSGVVFAGAYLFRPVRKDFSLIRSWVSPSSWMRKS
jgi:polysaccharide transporter, PST family